MVRRFFIFLAAVLAGFCLPGILGSRQADLSAVEGFVYEQDGTTPVEKAVVILESVFGETVYKSSPSKADGVFRVPRMEKGLYRLTVEAGEHEYLSEKLLGLRMGKAETAKLSILLDAEPAERASLAAWNHAVVYGFMKVNDAPREAGPFKPKSDKR